MAPCPAPGQTRLRRQLWRLSAALCLISLPAQADPKPIRCTLEQCYTAAVQRSPLMQAARLNIDQYDSKLREAQTAWYPKLDVSNFSTALPTLKPGRDGSDILADYDFQNLGPLMVSSVSVVQPLYTFGKISALKALARQGVDIARTTVRVAEDEMRYQLSRAWWGLVLVESLRDLTTDGLKLLKEQRDRLESARDDGDASFNQADLLKLNVYAAEIEEKVRQFDRNRAQAEDGIRLAMASEPDVPVQAAGELTAVMVPEVPSAAYEALALTNAPRLLAQRDGVQARLIQVDLAKNQLWPELVFVARLAYTYAPTRDSTTDSLATNPTNSATSGVGVAVRWSLDVFRQLEKIDQAKLDARQAVLQTQGEAMKLRNDVRQLYREMVDAKALIDIQGRALKAARGWLLAENQAYEDGFQEFPEVLRATETFYRKRMAHAEAIYNHNLAVAALSRAVGMDLTSLEASRRFSSAPATGAAKP